jgi:hypothetical protein
MRSAEGQTLMRPGLDASSTESWFTAEYPFLLDCTPRGLFGSVAAVCQRYHQGKKSNEIR